MNRTRGEEQSIFSPSWKNNSHYKHISNLIINIKSISDSKVTLEAERFLQLPSENIGNKNTELCEFIKCDYPTLNEEKQDC